MSLSVSKSLRGSAAAAFMFASVTGAASAEQDDNLPEKDGSRLILKNPARPVVAYEKFCQRYSGECDLKTDEPVIFRMDAKLWADLKGVNKTVNAAIKPVKDQDHHGVTDQWDYPADKKGDCEDYQLEKRRQLIGKGYHPSGLLMTVVIDDQGEGHAVLTVRTDRGDFVLDNKRDIVTTVDYLQDVHKYHFIKSVDPKDANAFVAYGGQIEPPAKQPAFVASTFEPRLPAFAILPSPFSLKH